MNNISKCLQKEDIDVLTVIHLYESLLEYTKSLRNVEHFDRFENMGKSLSGCDAYKADEKRKNARKLSVDETRTNETEFNGKENMIFNTYYVVLDRIYSELIRKKKSYTKFEYDFGFLEKLLILSDADVREKSKALKIVYKNDLDSSFPEECVQFKYFLKSLCPDSTNKLNLGNVLKR